MKLYRIVFFVTCAAIACSLNVDCNCDNATEPTTEGDPRPNSPKLLYPAFNVNNQSTTPTFVWDGNFDPDKFEYFEYEVTLYDDSGSETITWTLPVTRNTSIKHEDVLESNRLYSWKVTTTTDLNTKRSSVQHFKFMTGTGTNNPPGIIMYSPRDNEEDVSLSTLLMWEFLDPDDDPLSYDIWYREDSEAAPTVVTGLTDPEYPIPLLSDSYYRWNIIASDGQGGVDSSWYTLKFFTITTEPPSNPIPFDGEKISTTSIMLKWSCIDPDGNPLTFDVFMGVAGGNLNEVGNDIAENQFEISDLDYETEYQWKVTAEDTEGHRFHGPIWSFTIEAYQGVYAELTIHRSQWGTGDDWTRNDYISARFDSVHAPDGPIYPRRPAAVNFGTADRALEWQDYNSRYYFNNPYTGYFLFAGGSYFFTITGGDGVPSLVTDSIILPECRLEITSPEPFAWVSMDDGFELVWTGYDAYADCDRDVTIRIMDMGPIEWTDVNIVTANDGSYTFTADDLSGIDPASYQFQITLIIDNKENIIADGYDPRSLLWARVYTTQFIYRQ